MTSVLLPSLNGLNLNRLFSTGNVYVFEDETMTRRLVVQSKGKNVELKLSMTEYILDDMEAIVKTLNAHFEKGRAFFYAQAGMVAVQFSDESYDGTRPDDDILVWSNSAAAFLGIPSEAMFTGLRERYRAGPLDLDRWCDERYCYYDANLFPHSAEYNKYVHAAVAMFDRDLIEVRSSYPVAVRAKRGLPPSAVALPLERELELKRQRLELRIMLTMANLQISPRVLCAFLGEEYDLVLNQNVLRDEWEEYVHELQPRGVISILDAGWTTLYEAALSLTSEDAKDISVELNRIVRTLADEGFVMGAISKDTVVVRKVDGVYTTRLQCFDPSFCSQADEDVTELTSKNVSNKACLKLINGMLFVLATSSIEASLRRVLMKPVVMTILNSWNQMNAESTLCAALNREVPFERGRMFVNRTTPFPLLWGVSNETEYNQVLLEMATYVLYGFSSIHGKNPSEGSGYLQNIIDYIKTTFGVL